MKKHNFSAGPSILSNEVFKKASESILNLNNSGLSLIEISHRSKSFVSIMEEARELSISLLGLDKNEYTSLFLQGGASTQFLMIAYNFLKNKSGYINTGTWSDLDLSNFSIIFISLLALSLFETPKILISSFSKSNSY